MNIGNDITNKAATPKNETGNKMAIGLYSMPFKNTTAHAKTSALALINSQP